MMRYVEACTRDVADERRIKDPKKSLEFYQDVMQVPMLLCSSGRRARALREVAGPGRGLTFDRTGF